MKRLICTPLSLALLFGTLSIGCAQPDEQPTAQTDSLTNEEVPAEVRRRIAQAMWPENLFDSTGYPEPGFVRRPFRPAFGDLRITRREPIADLPGVVVFAGMAYPSGGCSHCRTWRVAVAGRGGNYVTLATPEEIQFLAGWAGRDVLGDSVRFRKLILGALRSTCFLGCEIREVRARSDIPDANSPFLLPAEGEDTTWSMPRTYSWQREGGTVVDFAAFAQGAGVYAIRAEWHGGEDVFVSVSPVAGYRFN